ncbi:DUF2621 family protein [Thermoactinomyces sp. DSM 45892]|uniref:DUF2621 family protein n=1 Tax=Thermoactinomyces sp. DSM 45892 TaxID=1882753 RepID=UPI000897DDAF|nr:DUF2621 family protein [Thermoactinomyces sp. DSM 45892]SDZ28809.1 Protein of unknown function [Thermoactinomyces sp. DSM 45892]
MIRPLWLQWAYTLFWIALFGVMCIGGYFMFRKFLKRLPKQDGRSELDWQEHYINETLHLWTDEKKALLRDLVAPVPELFRDVAKQKIAGKIGEIALSEKAKELKEEYIIRGYILATPKRDHKWLKETLQKKQIDLKPYQHLF